MTKSHQTFCSLIYKKDKQIIILMIAIYNLPPSRLLCVYPMNGFYTAIKWKEKIRVCPLVKYLHREERFPFFYYHSQNGEVRTRIAIQSGLWKLHPCSKFVCLKIGSIQDWKMSQNLLDKSHHNYIVFWSGFLGFFVFVFTKDY